MWHDGVDSINLSISVIQQAGVQTDRVGEWLREEVIDQQTKTSRDLRFKNDYLKNTVVSMIY